MPAVRRIARELPSPATRLFDLTVAQFNAVQDAAAERFIERFKRASADVEFMPLRATAKAVQRRTADVRAAVRSGVLPSKARGIRILIRTADARAWVEAGCPTSPPVAFAAS